MKIAKHPFIYVCREVLNREGYIFIPSEHNSVCRAGHTKMKLAILDRNIRYGVRHSPHKTRGKGEQGVNTSCWPWVWLAQSTSLKVLSNIRQTYLRYNAVRGSSLWASSPLRESQESRPKTRWPRLIFVPRPITRNVGSTSQWLHIPSYWPRSSSAPYGESDKILSAEKKKKKAKHTWYSSTNLTGLSVHEQRVKSGNTATIVRKEKTWRLFI
jgi:hypothetical protein